MPRQTSDRRRWLRRGTIDRMPAPPDLEVRRTVLAAGVLEYRLRRSPRSRSLRVTIDPRHGVVVSVPLATRRGWAHPEREVEKFLADREPWVRRHLARLDARRATITARGGIADGAEFRYLGEMHRLRIVLAPPGTRRSSVARHGADERDELHILVAARDRRAPVEVLRSWLRDRAASAVERAVAQHASAMRVEPGRITLRDTRSRWGSASRKGTLSFSWRLVLAPPAALDTVVIHELAHLRVFGHGSRFWALVAAERPDHVEWRRWLRAHSHELHAALDDPSNGGATN